MCESSKGRKRPNGETGISFETTISINTLTFWEIRVALGGFASLFRLRNINIPAFHLFDHQCYTLITDYFGNVLTFVHFGLSSRFLQSTLHLN